MRYLTLIPLALLSLLAFQPAPTDPPHPAVVTRVGSEDRHAAVQKAIDDAVAPNGGSVYLDGQGHTKPFLVDRPVIVRAPNVEIYGRNGASTLLRSRGYFSPVIVGMRYNSHPTLGTQPNCWQESADLDATAGKRYAIRTRKQSVVEFNQTPLDSHDWSTVTEFTIEAAFRCHESGAVSAGVVPICGAINYKSEVSPLTLFGGNDGTRLRVQTTTGLHVPRANWKPVLGQFYRLRVACKLGVPNGTKVWVNGNAVPMYENPTVTGNLVKKVCNHGWGLGRLSYDSYQWGSPGAHDTEYHGFRVIAGPSPYTDADAETRVDGATPTDLSRYFTKPAGTLLYLTLDENAPADRMVKWVASDVPGHGNPYGFAYFVRPSNGTAGQDAVGNVRIRDLWLASGPWGAGLMLSGCYRAVVSDCTINGGRWCVSSLPHFVAYPVTFKNCELIGGSMANGLMACRWTGTLENVQFTGYKSNAITALGCNLTARQCLITDVPGCDVAVRLLAGQAGGMYRFCDGTLFNFEGNGPSESYIDLHMETIPQSPMTNLVLDGVGFANNGPTGPTGRAYVRLYTGNNPHGNKGSLTSIGGSRYKYPLAQVHGAGWTVTTLGAKVDGVPAVIDKDGKPVAEVEPE